MEAGEGGNHAASLLRSMNARRSAGSMRKRRPILMYGIFLSQRRERTAHGVALNVRAAAWMSSRRGSGCTAGTDTTLRAIDTTPLVSCAIGTEVPPFSPCYGASLETLAVKFVDFYLASRPRLPWRVTAPWQPDRTLKNHTYIYI